MKKKKLLTFLGGICLVLILVAMPFLVACAAPAPSPAPSPAPAPAPTPTPAPAPAPKPEPITITYVTFHPLDRTPVIPFMWYLERVEERAKGEIVFEFKGGPEAIPFFQQPTAMADGVFDMNMGVTAFMESRLPIAPAFKFSQLSAEEEYESGVWDLMVEAFETVNVRLVGRVLKGEPDSYFYMFTNMPVETPYDLFRLKMNPAVGEDWFINNGATYVGMPPGDIYTAMERGVIDVFSWTWLGLHQWGWLEVSKYVIDTPTHVANGGVMMNLDKWNSIPEHLQKIMTDTLAEMQPEIEDFMAEEHEKERQRWRDAGIEFIQWSPSDVKWYRDSMYDTEWEIMIEGSPELGPRLKDLMTK